MKAEINPNPMKILASESLNPIEIPKPAKSRNPMESLEASQSLPKPAEASQGNGCKAGGPPIRQNRSPVGNRERPVTDIAAVQTMELLRISTNYEDCTKIVL